jgi:NAD(P)-dependent dehydrogenase (short-subunit alcohol dehydrogenase family)
VYVINGGLGRIGLEVADYLARTVRARIALVGRNVLPEQDHWARWLATHDESDPTSRKIRRVQAIEAAGGAVLVCRADVADERQMAAAIASTEACFGPVCGVMHAAGDGKGLAPIRSLRRRDCEQPFRARLEGLRVLEKVLQGRKLDFCLVHSSLASAMGVMEFVSYAASHIFMDAFAYRANLRNGTPWKTVNWDIWDRRHTGGASESEFYMNPREATEVLGRLLSVPEASRFLVSTGALQARIDQWVRREERAVEAVVEGASAPGAHPRPVLSTEYQPPRNDVERLLADIWAEMLGIDRVGILDNFFELGGDSVLNLQISARANRAGLRVTPKQVFEHQTIAALAAMAVPSASAAAGRSGPETDIEAPPGSGLTQVSESDLAEIRRQLGTQVQAAK